MPVKWPLLLSRADTAPFTEGQRARACLLLVGAVAIMPLRGNPAAAERNTYQARHWSTEASEKTAHLSALQGLLLKDWLAEAQPDEYEAE